MTEPGAPPQQRVVITIDNAAFSDSTIEYAVTMAARLKRPLHGVLIEDVDLLSCAELPFATEICISTGQPRSLDRRALQSAFGDLLLRFRRSLAQWAEPRAVQWTVSTMRGRRRDFHLDEPGSADYCIYEPGLVGRQTARPASRVKRVLAIDGGDEPFYQALAALLQPLAGSELHLTLVEPAAEAQFAGLLPSGVHIHHLTRERLAVALQHARENFDYVVVSGQRPLLELAPRLARLDCPLIVIG